MNEGAEIEFGLGKTLKLLIAAVVTLSVAIVFSFLLLILLRYFWCKTGLDNSCEHAYTIDNNSILIHNYLFGIGAFIGLSFAYYRLRIADNKVKSDDDAAVQQTYYEATKLLGESSVSARMAGILELIKLKENRPDQFAVPVIDILAGFIVHSVPKYRMVDNEFLTDEQKINDLDKLGNLDNPYIASYEAEIALIAIGDRSDADLKMYSSKWRNRYLGIQRAKISSLTAVDANLSYIDFSFSELARSNFVATNFTNSVLLYAKLNSTSFIRCVCIKTVFKYAEMNGVNFYQANLKNARFDGTKLRNAVFKEANVAGADFTNTDLCNVDLSEVLGLTQEQLDVALQSPGPEPSLSKEYKWDMQAAIIRWKEVQAKS